MCTFSEPKARGEAAAILYLLMKRNYEELKQFARMKLQATIAISKLVGEVSERRKEEEKSERERQREEGEEEGKEGTVTRKRMRTKANAGEGKGRSKKGNGKGSRDEYWFSYLLSVSDSFVRVRSLTIGCL